MLSMKDAREAGQMFNDC